MSTKNSIDSFLALVSAGLWETDFHFSEYGEVDYSEIYRMAEEQSVIGLIAAGLEHIVDLKVPKDIVLRFAGCVLKLEQRNSAMNTFIADIVEQMRSSDIHTLLIKGQGIAQCYERPHWRACGDVDFFLSDVNYSKAKEFLTPLASYIRIEGNLGIHHELRIDSFIVELHGDVKSGLSRNIDEVLTEVQEDVFYGGNVRSWMNGDTIVFLPGTNDDVVIVFTHIIKHLFRGGIGLRQICDWCRLLWKNESAINRELLYKRIRAMHLMTEWKTFASLVVDYLGMPEESIPMYDSSIKWKRKATRVMMFIMETGNFGHNRDISYQSKYNGVTRKMISLMNQLNDNYKLAFVFPWDAIRFLVSFTVHKTRKSLN